MRFPFSISGMATKRMQWSEENVELALSAMIEGLSLRQASSTYGIPKSTLALYKSGKSQIGMKPGQVPILSPDEEKALVEYVLHMSRIGYGRTKEQLQDIVQEILKKDGRPNPFKNDRPGDKWWKLFVKRHPMLSLRKPEQLQLSRARCCTPENIQHWIVEFEQFLVTHDLKDRPAQIWNADEAGFPLCPSTGKVIAMRNSRCVYGVTGDSKEQITTLCAVSAAGYVIPPMNIFAGERFKYNPMNNCVDNAYFGRSVSGWISTELFFGWIANHFAKKVLVRPVLLLVDGHSSHIDLHISKFCRDNGIYLYCLPPHSSHVLQPLDVSFFKPLKLAWSKLCDEYRFSNPGKVVTKYVFAEVFREAWISAIRMSTIINGFRESGICPLNPQAIPESKLAPSLPYSPTETQPKNSEANRKLHDLEEMMKSSTIALFNTRYEEGYDIEDEFYSIWSKLKTLSIGNKSPLNSSTELSPASSKESAEATPLLDEILTYPDPMKAKVKKGKSTSNMPKHLSGEQMIQYLENKRLEKERLEEEKIKRQEEREQNRRKREEEKEGRKRKKESREGAEKERQGFEEKRKYRKGRAERAWWRKWEWQRKREGKGEGEGE